MILEDALCDIKDRLLNTGYFTEVFEYCSMFEVNGVTRPMYSIGNELIDVHNFDRNGSGYIRKTGTVSITRANLPVTVACDGKIGLVEVKFPLRGVFAVPTKKLGGNGYSNDLLFFELLEVFHGAEISVNGTTCVTKVRAYETDRDKIYKEEVNSGNEPILELAYIYIDFDLIFTGSVDCFKTTCY